MRIAVVGAGVLGASAARELVARGHEVTLYEQSAPGHVRSGSGGETRLLRFSHGEFDWYTRLARRALERWRELERASGVVLFEPVGLAWFDSGEGDFSARSEETLRREGIACERLSAAQARRLYPSLGGEDLRSVLLEPEAGVLYARRATRALAHGLPLLTARPTPADPPDADVVVWACGSWLGELFPGLLPLRIIRRDVFLFGVEAAWSRRPAFCDYDAAYYGHAELGGLGLKVAPDHGALEIDPDTMERVPDRAALAGARAYLAHRFPGLAGAPVVGANVCQYDLTPDTHFVLAPHPERADWWLAGGTSGHGFKHGPALAEVLADALEGKAEPPPFLALGERTGDAGLRLASRSP